MLAKRHPGLQIDERIISTSGDRDKSTSLRVIGGQGVFVKELQRALLAGEIDCAVHSLKDVPAELPDGLMLAAIVEREDPRDVLVAPRAASFADLPHGARLGTSSRRRAAEALHQRPDLTIVDLRGNVDTRLRKTLDGSPEKYDAAILAAAGVIRMGRADAITDLLPVEQFVPAPAQGFLAVECRVDDQPVRERLSDIHDSSLAQLADAERAFLSGVGGGCRSPIGAHADYLDDGQIRLHVMYASEQLTDVRFETRSAPADRIVQLAQELAAEMIAEASAG